MWEPSQQTSCFSPNVSASMESKRCQHRQRQRTTSDWGMLYVSEAYNNSECLQFNSYNITHTNAHSHTFSWQKKIQQVKLKHYESELTCDTHTRSLPGEKHSNFIKTKTSKQTVDPLNQRGGRKDKKTIWGILFLLLIDTNRSGKYNQWVYFDKNLSRYW